MKHAYINKEFRSDSMYIIDKANEIIEYYEGLGYGLTLRQLYYQFVARDLVPNNMNSYKRLGSIINDARLAGLIDWNSISDRTRKLIVNPHWDKPEDILNSAAQQYALDKWIGSDTYIEVWVEKEALIDVVRQATINLDIPCFACRGYVSQSAMYEAAKRFENKEEDYYNYFDEYGLRNIIIHLGDHDPSGIDMTRDIQERLNLFNVDVDVDRIALNMDQVDHYNPPPNPAKLTDSRCKGYISNYGRSSWELDALDPTVISDMIIDKINEYMDFRIFDTAKEKEDKQKEAMKTMIEEFDFSEGEE